eukprot:301849-Hanusia_phi.AAC.3
MTLDRPQTLGHFSQMTLTGMRTVEGLTYDLNSKMCLPTPALHPRMSSMHVRVVCDNQLPLRSKLANGSLTGLSACRSIPSILSYMVSWLPDLHIDLEERLALRCIGEELTRAFAPNASDMFGSTTSSSSSPTYATMARIVKHRYFVVTTRI